MARTIVLLLIQFIINHFLCVTRFFKLKCFLLNLVPGIHIEKNVKVVGPIYVTGQLNIGENTWVGNDFRVEGNGTVTIEANCDIAPAVQCFTGTHEIGSSKRRAGAGINQPIIVGNGCWICGATKILPGITIGHGCVISAGAVVNKDIPDNVLAGGVPAHIIKTFSK